MSLQTFPSFVLLPPELRHMIWKFALRPRTLGVQYIGVSENWPVSGSWRAEPEMTELIPGRPMPRPFLESFESLSLDSGDTPSSASQGSQHQPLEPIPSPSAYLVDLGLLSACDESRYFFIKHYQYSPWEAWMAGCGWATYISVKSQDLAVLHSEHRQNPEWEMMSMHERFGHIAFDFDERWLDVSAAEKDLRDKVEDGGAMFYPLLDDEYQDEATVAQMRIEIIEAEDSPRGFCARAIRGLARAYRKEKSRLGDLAVPVTVGFIDRTCDPVPVPAGAETFSDADHTYVEVDPLDIRGPVVLARRYWRDLAYDLAEHYAMVFEPKYYVLADTK